MEVMIPMIKLTSRITTSLPIALVLGGFLLGIAPAAYAVAPGPFGGRILFVFPCDEGELLQIGPPRGGWYMFIPGASRLFTFFAIRVGAWTLGLAGPVAACTIDGEPVGGGPLVLFMGTSL